VEGQESVPGQVRQHVNFPAAPGYEFFEAALGVVSFADAAPGGDDVSAE
jgi:hypothetical protein